MEFNLIKNLTDKVSNKHAEDINRAYVTFLAGDKDYVKGVIGLAKGHRKVKSKYPLVVAVLPDVPMEHRLIDQFVTAPSAA